jgi:DNA polymerase V
VVVSGIIPDKQVQLSLLDSTDHAREHTLIQFIDNFERDTVKVAAQGTPQKKAWNLNRQHLSPCYTTRLQHILTINI